MHAQANGPERAFLYPERHMMPRWFEGIRDTTSYPYSSEHVKVLYERLAELSELPTSVVFKGDMDYSERNMPNAIEIKKRWWEILVHLNKFDSLSEFLEEGTCWACGLNYESRGLQRAHILARSEGGSDTASNFHLLCQFCHHVSENLSGKSYWDWFKSPWGSIHTFVYMRGRFEKHPELLKESWLFKSPIPSQKEALAAIDEIIRSKKRELDHAL